MLLTEKALGEPRGIKMELPAGNPFSFGVNICQKDCSKFPRPKKEAIHSGPYWLFKAKITLAISSNACSHEIASKSRVPFGPFLFKGVLSRSEEEIISG